MRKQTISYIKEPSGCWICISHVCNSAGYPTAAKNGQVTTLHRIIYEDVYGPIPAGLLIRHRCDRRRCINPAHLEVGTLVDNVQDRVSRNRSAVGSRHANAKLSELFIPFIRRSPLSVSALAHWFGVARHTIRDVKQGKTWKHVA